MSNITASDSQRNFLKQSGIIYTGIIRNSALVSSAIKKDATFILVLGKELTTNMWLRRRKI